MCGVCSIRMYYPQEPKEPSGCWQTVIITRAILGILLLPLTLIMGSIVLILLTFYALSVHPLLALLVIVSGAVIIVGLARWESRRIARENPPEDQ